MAHGDKKWITTYDGRLKRSNDRTKKDFYGDLKWWNPMEDSYGPSLCNRKKKFKPFCPQCKHVMKDAVRIRNENFVRNRRLWDEYNELYLDLRREWRWYRAWKKYEWEGAPLPEQPEPPTFHEWVENVKKYVTWSWSFDDRNFLCFKCERKNEFRDQMWHRAMARDFRGQRRMERRKYRVKVKHMMHNERYDDIPCRKNGWLD